MFLLGLPIAVLIGLLPEANWSRTIALMDQAELERAEQAEFDGLAAGFVTRGDRLG